ncbi:MAG TPA: outer membrane protein transport protein [Azonexus sp.]
MNSLTLRALPAILLAALSSAAAAAGFQNWEQNAADLGSAHAGSAAVADTAAGLYYNPAGLTRLDGVHISAGLTGLRPIVEFDNGGSNGPALGLGNGGDAGRWLALPNASMSWRIAPDLAIGFGITTPFGLDLDYDNANWIGRVHAQSAEISTVNYNPALAYRVSERLSLGIGLNYQRIDLDLASAGLRLKGDDGSWGWNAGALFTLSPAMRVGLSYRSAIDHELDGSANGQAARADLTLPDTAILSVWQQVSDRWEAMGDLSYTRWNRLKQLAFVDRHSGMLLVAEPFRYDNSWRLAWGAAYRVSDGFKLKFGFAWERSPIGDSGRTAYLPEEDSLRLSLGGQWLFGRLGRLDAGYSYQFSKDPKIAQYRNAGGANLLRGDYETGSHTVGAQYSLGF